MLLRYLLVDSSSQFRLVDQEDVEHVWHGRMTTRELGWQVDDEFRLVSVLCAEDDLAPQICFFLRTRLRNGEITDESRFEAYDEMTRYGRALAECDFDSEQLLNWPPDWQQQLAVALDVPVVQLRKIGVGGPLLMCDLWGYSVERILEFFEQACRD